MKRSKSSQRWLQRQASDPYVRRSKAEGYRSRAAYKLLEIDRKDRLLRPGLCVVDLGAAPGGWAQVAAQAVGRRGRVLALDLLEMPPIEGVDNIIGDFHDEAVLAQALAWLDAGESARGADLVLSDMAPNVSGMKVVDQPKSMLLVELAMDFAERVLKPGGNLVVKAFQGAGFDEALRDLRGHFDKVVCRKPEASRSQSRETYFVAKGFRVG
ncbi:23S rRNA methyltransferase [Thiohalocapsa halophila]|uniref:Ribosomal RNA large subunit methyltransferase E n=1 Tax=Thiohalocapsa halophila TaxID=69359 RepID=A0ABS1CEZ8_9GAMM|nr:RlmE family RNA methyltransferase [Thiohalocapsa halophila]MBK1629966.1 23S rRNA methyltransferase [Thiohalocapsa halophila]